MPKGFHTNIESVTLRNNYYRRVLFTTKNMQLVVMSLKPSEEIGIEKHKNTTQFIRVEKGTGMAIIGSSRYRLKDGSIVMIPPNTWHNIINTSRNKSLKLYTLYAPPEHPKNRKQKKKPVSDHE